MTYIIALITKQRVKDAQASANAGLPPSISQPSNPNNVVLVNN